VQIQRTGGQHGCDVAGVLDGVAFLGDIRALPCSAMIKRPLLPLTGDEPLCWVKGR